MNDLKIFGETVAKKRKKAGFSQEGLAFKAGLHRTYIGMVERGEKNITLKSIIKIASALGCHPKELLEDI